MQRDAHVDAYFAFHETFRRQRNWVDNAAGGLADTPTPFDLTSAIRRAGCSEALAIDAFETEVGAPSGFGRRALIEAAEAAREESHRHALRIGEPRRDAELHAALGAALMALESAESLAPMDADLYHAAESYRQAARTLLEDQPAPSVEKGSPGNPTARAVADAVVAIYCRETLRPRVTRPTAKHELAKLLALVGEALGFKRPLGPGLLRPRENDEEPEHL